MITEQEQLLMMEIYMFHMLALKTMLLETIHIIMEKKKET